MTNAFKHQGERPRESGDGVPGQSRATPLALLAAAEARLVSFIRSASRSVVDGFAAAGVAHAGMSPVHVLHSARNAGSLTVFRYHLGEDTVIVLTRDAAQPGDPGVRVEFERASDGPPTPIAEYGHRRGWDGAGGRNQFFPRMPKPARP